MIKEIYLDNSATTKPYKEVVDVMVQMLTDNYGNPSSLHKKGIEAEMEVKKTREIIANKLDVKSKEIFFTSGGTESNNIAILGSVFANKRLGNHIITSAIEHPSVLNTFKALEEKGYRVSYINVDKNGLINLKELEKEVCKDTILISIMHVNNEVGTIQPVKEIKDILNAKDSKALLHMDATQSFGKVIFSPKKLGVDLMTVSSHKIHGPKGVGALYVKDGVHISPIVYGGGQELDLRSGTENVPGIVGFGKAVELTFENIDEKIKVVNELKQKLKEGIINRIENIKINGQAENISAPHILNVSFRDTRSEVLLHSLESKGIYVSSGSACSSHKPSQSYVLTAMGVDRKEIEGTIRFSFSTFNTKDDIKYCLEQLTDIVPKLRKFTRR